MTFYVSAIFVFFLDALGGLYIVFIYMKLVTIALFLSCFSMAEVPVKTDPAPSDVVQSALPSYFGKEFNTLIVVPVALKKFNGDFTRRHGDWSPYYRAYTSPNKPDDPGIETVFYDEIAYRACMAALEKEGKPLKLVGYEAVLMLPIIRPTPHERVPAGEKDVAGLWTLRRVFVVLRPYVQGDEALK